MIQQIKDKLKSTDWIYKNYIKLFALLRAIKYQSIRDSLSKKYFNSTTDFIFNRSKVNGLPTTVTIEPANICNINCPICETGNGTLNRVKRVLSTEDFKKIIDQIYTHTDTLIYYFMGEPFLNKHWVEQVQYAKSLGIKRIETSTNGDIAVPIDIVNSKLDHISFQIGGMTQETHGVYRVNSYLKTVFEKLKETISLKKKMNATWLNIDVGLIVMKHNEHEIEEFKLFCEEIGADSYQIVLPVVRNALEGKQYLPENEEYLVYDKEKLEQGELLKKDKIKNYCPWMYYSTVILSNGDLVPCCEDSCGKHVLGNVIEEGFDAVWNGKKYQNFRKNVNNNQDKLKLCDLCSSYGIGTLH